MNRHGHSMSLAQPSTQSLFPYNNGSVASLNPFGHDAVLGSDQMPSRSPRVSPGPPAIGEIHAPQGRVPVALPSLAPPLSVSRPDSRPDFTRGFGLDIPEEEEEEEEVAEDENMSQADSDEEGFDEEVDDDEDRGTEDAGMTTASQSQRHSRHTSKLSTALSLRSFGVFNVDGINERTDLEPIADGNISMEEKHDLDGVEEWTGSEDVFMGHESSDDEVCGDPTLLCLLTNISFRVSANGQILQMKKGHGSSVLNAEYGAEPYSKMLNSRDVYLTSLVHLKILSYWLDPARKILYLIRARKSNCMTTKAILACIIIMNVLLQI